MSVNLRRSRPSFRRDLWFAPAVLQAHLLLFFAPLFVDAVHHMKRIPPHTHLSSRQTTDTPLIITNSCDEALYPAILTQHGIGPGTGGFRLNANSTRTLSVSADWQGRVWGRSNCTFNGNIGQCGSGDCGRVLSCVGTVKPASIACRLSANEYRDKCPPH